MRAAINEGKTCINAGYRFQDQSGTYIGNRAIIVLCLLCLLQEGMAFVPSGWLGKRLAFDDGGNDTAMDDERNDGATCDETQSDASDMFHSATFPRVVFAFIVRYFVQGMT